MTNFPKQCSIYWFNPNPVKGSEMSKVRPCVIVSPDEMNENLHTVIVVPLTSTIQPWPFRLNINFLGKKSGLACDQIRAIDKTRIKSHIGKLKSADRDKLFDLLQLMFSE